MKDLYINVHLASTFSRKSIVLFMSMLSFTELKFKWYIHVTDVLNQLHAMYT